MPSEHDPGPGVATERANSLLENPHTAVKMGSSSVRIGVAGWTDRTLTESGVFYPPHASSAEDRLRFYASVFPLVEVDSAYYALPSSRNAQLWVDRTPADFRFNIKAFALMTGHPAEVSRLPATLIADLPKEIREKERFYAKDIPADLVDRVWEYYVEGIAPLAENGRLGAILLQYPKWFLATSESAAELARARRRLGDLPAAVEFRNPKWLTPRLAERTFALLRDNGFSYVCVDEPQGLPNSVPPLVAVTNEKLAMVRLHGRREEFWNKAGATVHERFRYLYGGAELAEWVPRVQALAEEAAETHVVFNNCYANYGTTNALEIGELFARIYGS